MLPTVAALLSLLRRPRPEQEPPAPAPRKRSGTYPTTRPREAVNDLDAWLAEFVSAHPCRGDEEHLGAADIERYMVAERIEGARDERGLRDTIPDV